MEERSRAHFREAKSFASRTLGSPLSESNFFSQRFFSIDLLHSVHSDHVLSVWEHTGRCFAIVPVTAAVFHFAYFTSTNTHAQCSRGNRTPPLLVCESHDVHSKASSFPIIWFSHVLGHCHGWFLHVLGHCFGQRSCVSFAYVTLYRAGACEANDQRSAQRSVRSVSASDRSVGDLRSTGRKV